MGQISKKDAAKVMDILFSTYPGLEPFLTAANPYQSLVATILSAQTTDLQVNKVTPDLFAEYPGPESLAKASVDQVISYIKSIGFFRNKAKNIINASKKIVEDFNGQVPDNMDDLLTLPGVGRKTANVVMANSFGIPSVPVDTHVFRVTNRIGLSESKNPEECEQDLRKILDEDIWNYSHLSIIKHGREVCRARNPKCEVCPISEFCKYYKANIKGKANTKAAKKTGAKS